MNPNATKIGPSLAIEMAFRWQSDDSPTLNDYSLAGR